MLADTPSHHRVLRITEEARREVGQWRTTGTSGVSLEREQEELLKALVEATRNVPRDQRQKFHCLSDGEGDHVLHPGLPGRELRIYEGDIDILDAEGLLNVTYSRQPGTRSFDVTPLRLRLYEELQHRSGAPAQQVEERLQRHLEGDAFQQKYPEAYRKWAEAAELLWASDSQEQLTTIGHLCREAVQEFATGLVDQYQPPGVDQNKAHDVNRVQAVLDQHRAQLGTTAAPFLDALVAYWRTVSALVQRQEHGVQKAASLVWEDGRRVVFQTLVVMFEIDRALN
jgi:hypothetical protein